MDEHARLQGVGDVGGGVERVDGAQYTAAETFQAFGFAERIIAEAYRITEMAFWKPDPQNPAHIVRAARAHNKCIAAACGQPDVPFWLGLGIDLLFCTNDIVCLKKAAGDSLKEARDLMSEIAERKSQTQS